MLTHIHICFKFLRLHVLHFPGILFGGSYSVEFVEQKSTMVSVHVLHRSNTPGIVVLEIEGTFPSGNHYNYCACFQSWWLSYEIKEQWWMYYCILRLRCIHITGLCHTWHHIMSFVLNALPKSTEDVRILHAAAGPGVTRPLVFCRC
jgi:hypothetical protein